MEIKEPIKIKNITKSKKKKTMNDTIETNFNHIMLDVINNGFFEITRVSNEYFGMSSSTTTLCQNKKL